MFSYFQQTHKSITYWFYSIPSFTPISDNANNVFLIKIERISSTLNIVCLKKNLKIFSFKKIY